MNSTFLILTIVLIIVAVAMILIILVQRPQGGGLASAFGGAGGGGTDTVFGGRVGDALTVMTVVAFTLFLGLAVALNLVESKSGGPSAAGTSNIVTTDVNPNVPATDSTITDIPIVPSTVFPDDESDGGAN
jgi:preprotein translocase subunit SecG